MSVHHALWINKMLGACKAPDVPGTPEAAVFLERPGTPDGAVAVELTETPEAAVAVAPDTLESPELSPGAAETPDMPE